MVLFESSDLVIVVSKVLLIILAVVITAITLWFVRRRLSRS